MRRYKYGKRRYYFMFKSINKLQDAIEKSKGSGVFIYKFSVTCQGCSPATKQEIESFMKYGEKYEYYIIPVQNERELCGEVESKLGVKHQSPQLIFVKDGQAVFDLDHWDISEENIKEKLEELKNV